MNTLFKDNHRNLDYNHLWKVSQKANRIETLLIKVNLRLINCISLSHKRNLWISIGSRTLLYRRRVKMSNSQEYHNSSNNSNWLINYPNHLRTNWGRPGFRRKRLLRNKKNMMKIIINYSFSKRIRKLLINNYKRMKWMIRAKVKLILLQILKIKWIIIIMRIIIIIIIKWVIREKRKRKAWIR